MSSPGSVGTSRRRSALVLLAVLVSGACSSDDGRPRATSTPAATTAPAASSAPEPESRSSTCRPARIRTTSPRPETAASGTPRRAPARSAISIRTPGETKHIALGEGSAPHGVIVGPDGAPWITDSGLNAIVRVDPETEKVDVYPLPDDAPDANLNTATFDGDGVLWFTGQRGIYGGSTRRRRRRRGVRRAGRRRPVRHHHHTGRRRLLRVACREPHRAHRPRIEEGDADRSADGRAGRAPCVVGLERDGSG